MIDTARRDDFQQIAGQVRNIVGQLSQAHFGDFCSTDSWSPPINLYHLDRRLEVCVDLAGVNKSDIDVRVEPGRLIIRGHRRAPDPRDQHEGMRIVTMEIDHGPFARLVSLPPNIDLPRVTTEYKEGLLWITLPLRSPG